MTAPIEAPSLYVASALRRHFVPLAFAGVCLGLAHLALWSPAHPQTFALLLWLDEAPMSTLFFLTITLMISGAFLYRFRNRSFHQKIAARIEPAIQFLIRSASVTAQVTFGMGLVAAFSGAAPHALLIVFFIVYLVAMMEVSTGLWRRAGLSKAAPYLMHVMIVAPFISRIL